MDYTKKQLKEFDDYLLRDLEAGDSFKVLENLQFNFNREMEHFEDEWVKVEEHFFFREDSYIEEYYLNEDDEMKCYYIYEEKKKFGDSSFWHPYHMNIRETNLAILKQDGLDSRILHSLENPFKSPSMPIL